MQGASKAYDGRHAGLVFLAIFVAELLIAAIGLLVLLDAGASTGATSRALVVLAQDRTWFGLFVGVCASAFAAHLVLPRFDRPVGPPLRAYAVERLIGGGVLVGFVAAIPPALLAMRRGEASFDVASVPLALGLALVALGLCSVVRALQDLPASLVRASLAVLAGGMAVSALGSLLFDASPAMLQRWTLLAVDAVVRALYADATSDLAHQIVGTHAFRVRIFPSCSGVEGMTLGVLLVAPYLFLVRDELRFPRAFLLLPCAVGALGVANVARIVLFIAVGRRASRVAADAFHSSIGWFLFVGTIALVVPSVERVLHLRKARIVEDVDAATPDNPAVPFLLPLIVSASVVFAIGALALSHSHFALLRYAATAVALLALRTRLRLGAFTEPRAIVAGLLVAGMYLVAVPASASVAPLVALTFGGDAIGWKVVHAFGFTLVTPLVEELAFRGYLLRRFVSPSFDEVAYERPGLIPLGVSSVIFGAMHADFVLATVSGVVFGQVARRGGGLGGAIVAHAVANGALAAYALATGHLGVVG